MRTRWGTWSSRALGVVKMREFHRFSKGTSRIFQGKSMDFLKDVGFEGFSRGDWSQERGKGFISTRTHDLG